MSSGCPPGTGSADQQAHSSDFHSAMFATGQRIWQGSLHVRGHRNEMVLPCVGVRYQVPMRRKIKDAKSWPQHLELDSSKLKGYASTSQSMHEHDSEWYVRFIPVDDTGAEVDDPKLFQLVQVMVQREISFEIDCNKSSGTLGTLYICGMKMPPHGFSLIGVFRPRTTNEEIEGVTHALSRL